MLVIITLVKIFRKGSMSIANKKTMIVLCSMPFLSILALQQYALHFVAVPYAPTAFEVIPILSLIVINVFVFVLVEMLMRQNEKNQKLLIIEVQNDAHKTHIKQLTKYQKQIRMMSHDFRQQVHEFYTLSAEKQYDKLHVQLTELSNRRSENLIVETGNIMLDSILTSKVELAETHKIDFKKKLDVQAELGYITSEICVLIGNALDNAIEACIRADDNKFIGMELTATPKQFLCHIINTVGITPQTDGKFLKTAKQDSLHHGIGLQSMSQICEDLSGTLTYSYDEEYFNLWIKITIESV
jgi:sensor histidine kinase regulating citrate/malate metabolism